MKIDFDEPAVSFALSTDSHIQGFYFVNKESAQNYMDAHMKFFAKKD
jgi:hypothetical protein